MVAILLLGIRSLQLAVVVLDLATEQMRLGLVVMLQLVAVAVVLLQDIVTLAHHNHWVQMQLAFHHGNLVLVVDTHQKLK
jgi:hypothetical protein